MPVTRAIFHSRNKGHRIGADSVQAEVRYADGRIAKPSHMIVFDNGLFVTEKPAEIKVIEGTTEFKLGRIKRVTQEQAHEIIAVEAKKLNLPVEVMKEHETLTTPADAGYEETEKVVT